MKAEINSWCVTFYGEGDEASRASLRRIYDAAERTKKETGIGGAGSVGVVDPPSAPDVMQFVTLFHCAQKEAEMVLKEAGFEPDSIRFERVHLEPLVNHKHNSAHNRRVRLGT